MAPKNPFFRSHQFTRRTRRGRVSAQLEVAYFLDHPFVQHYRSAYGVQNDSVEMGRKPLTEEQRAEMRAKILDAAREGFLEAGPRGVSMRSVGAKVGVSAMTLYLYFENRQAILMALVQEGILLLRAKLAEVMEHAPSNPQEQLVALGDAYLAFARQNPQYYRALFVGDPEEEPIERSTEDRLKSEVMETLAPLISTITTIVGDPRVAIERSIALWCALHGFATFSEADRFRFLGLPSEEIREALKHLLMRLVDP